MLVKFCLKYTLRSNYALFDQIYPRLKRHRLFYSGMELQKELCEVRTKQQGLTLKRERLMTEGARKPIREADGENLRAESG